MQAVRSAAIPKATSITLEEVLGGRRANGSQKSAAEGMQVDGSPQAGEKGREGGESEEGELSGGGEKEQQESEKKKKKGELHDGKDGEKGGGVSMMEFWNQHGGNFGAGEEGEEEEEEDDEDYEAFMKALKGADKNVE
mgnify:CR=1 FL=1